MIEIPPAIIGALQAIDSIEPIEKAFLFGSRLSGGDGNDWDIAVYTRRYLKAAERIDLRRAIRASQMHLFICHAADPRGRLVQNIERGQPIEFRGKPAF